MIKVIAFDVGNTITKNGLWLNKDVFRLALRLKKNYKVGLLSNIVKLFSFLPLYRHIYSSFDKKLVVLSCRVKTKKPKKEIYEIFIKNTGCLPDECLFIDDRLENILGAEKNGMKNILFTNYKNLIEEMLKLGITV